MSLFLIEKPTRLSSPGRAMGWQVGPVTFHLQQIIQDLFLFLDVTLRPVQNLPLRTETDKLTGRSATIQTGFADTGAPFSGLRPWDAKSPSFTLLIKSIESLF